MKRIGHVLFVFFALNLILWAQNRPQIAAPSLLKTALVAVAPDASTEPASEDFKTEMQTVVRVWKDSFNNNDMDKLAGLYTEDAALIDEDGVIEGRSVLREAFTKFKASGASMTAITVDRAERSGNMGYVTDSWTEAAPKSGGGTDIVDGHSLIVMKRVGNKWLIAQHAAIAIAK
jgi:ketosteroid isomerase-like protein